jgi:hypothetical protein
VEKCAHWQSQRPKRREQESEKKNVRARARQTEERRRKGCMHCLRSPFHESGAGVDKNKELVRVEIYCRCPQTETALGELHASVWRSHAMRE